MTAVMSDFDRRRHQIRQRHIARRYGRVFFAGRELIDIPMLTGAAGSYPDAPSRRMAWDDDGTIMLWYTTEGGNSAATEVNAATKQNMNDEASGAIDLGAGNLDWRAIQIFPELREIDGFYFCTANANTFTMWTSPDTTNGFDGTWTQRLSGGSWFSQASNVYGTYRDNINSLAVSNIRGTQVRKSGNTGNQDAYDAAHIYGEISAGETPDRLLWIDQATALEFTKPIDYGDTPRGSQVDKIVQLKNNSSTLTAASVQITAEALYLGSAAWYTFSEGGAFSSTLALASSIGPGASSPNITIRRIISDAETLGLHAARAYVNVGTWS